MSLTAELSEKASLITNINQAIEDEIRGLSVLDVVNDPAFTLSETGGPSSVEKEPQELTLYQLNAKLKDLESSTTQLNEFWIIKNLFKEVELSLESGSGDEATWDKEDLQSTIKNMENLHEKVSKVSQMNLVISSSMKAKYQNLLLDFNTELNRVFYKFIPTNTSSEYIVHNALVQGNKTLRFDDFVEVAHVFETLYQSDRVSDLLNSLKTDWDRSILEPLISKRALLNLRINDQKQILGVEKFDAMEEFSMDGFFHSLQCFVHFVNATNLRSLKNYFSTKISNGLADIISENIRNFTEDEENLTSQLLKTLDLFSSSGWSIPIRNIFMAKNNVRETLRGLHLDWITDKYIDQLRTIFTNPGFDKDLSTQRTESHTIEIQPPMIHVSNSQNVPHLSTNETSPVDDASEEIEWDDNWGSDDDEDFDKATKASANSDAWDDNWDESWSDDEGEHGSNVQVKTQHQVQNKSTAGTNHAKQENIEKSTPTTQSPQIHTESYSSIVSAIPKKISNILSEFEKETDSADSRILLDTIFSLALASYPAISQSFLLLNDLRSVECKSTHLSQCADTEWKHFCQSFSNDVTQILSKASVLNSGSGSEDVDGDGGFESVERIGVLLEGLVGSELRTTNSYELKQFVLQVLNLTNNITLQKILRCDEITEYQSEEFTRYLEHLQVVEAGVLSKFGEDTTALATTNKVMQTKFLINNHLKSIMEYFYQGELYDFTTDELVNVIKSVFIPSDLRENCLNEIIDVRNS
ncbi:hypothetical protein JCM33374_g5852 [Metschnikowia sp. JCM 33374]|nr:hypothetical protein JCM33374_g5852 [Metschnikowia sp. JCM 33374]